MDNDDVLEARIASGTTTTSSSRNSLRLASRSSTIASITSFALTRSPSACTGVSRASAASASVRGQFSFCRERRQGFAELYFRLIGGAHPRIEEVDAMPRLCRQLRDPRAHRAGADDADLHFARQGVRHRVMGFYCPVKRGGRFAMNAATPSR